MRSETVLPDFFGPSARKVSVGDFRVPNLATQWQESSGNEAEETALLAPI